MITNKEPVIVRALGLCDYVTVWQQLKSFTHDRNAHSVDQIWWLEHPPVFTQGQAGKAEHILNPDTIPVVQSDRGGQVTYHGPGQLIVYTLCDIGRKKINVRQFVEILEQSVITLLQRYNITSANRCDAPGVYVGDSKICSIGLRVRHGRTYHGLSLNVAMDLKPFTQINPCGYTNMNMTQMSELCTVTSVAEIVEQLLPIMKDRLGYI